VNLLLVMLQTCTQLQQQSHVQLTLTAVHWSMTVKQILAARSLVVQHQPLTHSVLVAYQHCCDQHYGQSAAAAALASLASIAVLHQQGCCQHETCQHGYWQAKKDFESGYLPADHRLVKEALQHNYSEHDQFHSQ